MKRVRVAELLRKSPAAITQFLKGQNAPTDSTLDHFKLVLARERPSALQPPALPVDVLPPEEILRLREDVVDYAVKLQALPENEATLVKKMLDTLIEKSKPSINYRKVARAEKLALDESLAEIERVRAARQSSNPESRLTPHTPPRSVAAPSSGNRKHKRSIPLGDT